VNDRNVNGTRGLIEGLETPHPLAGYLPGVYEEDDLAGRFTLAFDESLAPVFCSLDNFASYLDPQLAPSDFLEWLAGWVGLALDDRWPVERRRALVARAVLLYRRRGTAAGLAEHVEVFTGGRPEIVENGGTAWSVTPESPMPGTPGARLTVRLRARDPGTVDTPGLEALVRSATPAHVVAEVEVATE
jgi:phage tail-like protein